MKEIYLTQGKIAFVDDEDFERLNCFKWFAQKDSNTFYAVRNVWNKVTKKQNRIRMHHEVIGKPSGGLMADHIDGNGLNNTRANLRHVTRRQNGQNRHCIRSSGYPGVYWHKTRKKWRSRIKVNGKDIHIGYFKTEQEAFNAYKKVVEQYGETIITN